MFWVQWKGLIQNEVTWVVLGNKKIIVIDLPQKRRKIKAYAYSVSIGKNVAMPRNSLESLHCWNTTSRIKVSWRKSKINTLLRQDLKYLVF